MMIEPRTVLAPILAPFGIPQAPYRFVSGGMNSALMRPSSATASGSLSHTIQANAVVSTKSPMRLASTALGAYRRALMSADVATLSCCLFAGAFETTAAGVGALTDGGTAGAAGLAAAAGLAMSEPEEPSAPQREFFEYAGPLHSARIVPSSEPPT